MLRWLKGQGARPSAVAKMQTRIPPACWQQVLNTYPFLAQLNPAEQAQLQVRTAWLLASKTINGAQGLDITDTMRLSIAMQASLPILYLPPTLYEGWDEIIVYPADFRIRRCDEDDIGVVHEYFDEASGEAWEGGPIILSWAESQSPQAGFNVVIHEFAHKLDLHTGYADGMPSLAAHPHLSASVWRRVLDESFQSFTMAVEAIDNRLPSDVDPDSEAAAHFYDRLPLDAYAASDEAEFFAVSSEQFFTHPAPLQAALPAWYDLLRAYYRPAATDAPA